ncbi:hypothetical protein WICMUC_003668 [Wickerhamomyces mucosus]|uniref:Protein SYM1 n=1 Tax=Wickerhamomyces mucosus TaxID=1378264 RepID=A0A9P8TBZ8_9ASCO|nr:hypothetical protein WICMUC_003668 [Wickerhamomyces mucosus]
MSKYFRLYQDSLIRRPFLTNALTTGFLFGSGDVFAQLIFPSQSGKSARYDYGRTIRSVIYGGCIFSFIGDKWYKFLSKNIVASTPTKTNLLKMTIDQLCFAPIGIPLYYTMMSILELRPIEEIKTKLKDNWWSTLTVNWMVWPFFQFLNFNYIPVRHNLLSVNVFSIFWNTFLSYKNSLSSTSKDLPVHFPPVPE